MLYPEHSVICHAVGLVSQNNIWTNSLDQQKEAVLYLLFRYLQTYIYTVMTNCNDSDYTLGVGLARIAVMLAR
jgi:hypothetical protein